MIRQMNKRGDYSAIFVFMVFAFVTVLFAVVFTYVGGEVQTQLHTVMDKMDIGANNTNVSVLIDSTIGSATESYRALRWITILLIVGMLLAILMGSYLVSTYPIYFLPYIFVVIISIFVGAGISNAYELLLANPTLNPVFADFNGASWFMLRLPIINTIIGFAGAIIMFISWRLGQSQGQGVYYG